MWLIDSLTHIVSSCSFFGDYTWLQMFHVHQKKVMKMVMNHI